MRLHPSAQGTNADPEALGELVAVERFRNIVFGHADGVCAGFQRHATCRLMAPRCAPKTACDSCGMKRVLVVLYPGCTYGELSPLLQVLEGAAEIVTTGPTAEPLRVQEGISIGIDCSLADAISCSEEIALIALPGGDITSIIDDRALGVMLSRGAGNTTVAGICHGVLLAACAGLAHGRRVTHTAIEKYAPRPTWDRLLAQAERLFAHSLYVDEDVVIDGSLITAKPWAAIDFAKHASVRAGLLSSAEAASRARYLRGVRDGSSGDPHVRYAIFLEQIPKVPTTREDVEAHVDHLRRLEREGLLELAGPFPEHASGLIVVRAATLEEAEAIARRDPFVARGVRRAEVRRWLISCDDSNHLMGA